MCLCLIHRLTSIIYSCNLDGFLKRNGKCYIIANRDLAVVSDTSSSAKILCDTPEQTVMEDVEDASPVRCGTFITDGNKRVAPPLSLEGKATNAMVSNNGILQ